MDAKQAAEILGRYARDLKNKHLAIQAEIDAAESLAAATSKAEEVLAGFEDQKAELQSDIDRLTVEKRNLEQSAKSAQEMVAKLKPSMRALDDREKAVSAREAAVVAREEKVLAKEERAKTIADQLSSFTDLES
jgi:SMC interacting uncharacterized protein involved in chromosome segregation